MSRKKRPGGPYVQPMDSAGALLVDEKGRGKYTLLANTTYFFIVGGSDAPLHTVQLEWDGALVITSAKIEDCNCGEADVTDVSVVDGEWVHEDPTTAYVSVKASDGSTGNGTVTNATLAVTGGVAGGAMWHLGNAGAARTRLKVATGATGGVARVSAHGKAT